MKIGKLTVRGISLIDLAGSNFCPAITTIWKMKPGIRKSIEEYWFSMQNNTLCIWFLGTLGFAIWLVYKEYVVFHLMLCWIIILNLLSFGHLRQKVSWFCEDIELLHEQLISENPSSKGLSEIKGDHDSILEAFTTLIQLKTNRQRVLELEKKRTNEVGRNLAEAEILRKRVHAAAENLGFKVGGYGEYFEKASELVRAVKP